MLNGAEDLEEAIAIQEIVRPSPETSGQPDVVVIEFDDLVQRGIVQSLASSFHNSPRSRKTRRLAASQLSSISVETVSSSTGHE